MSLTVKVRHPKGGMCFGKIVRYEEALDRSPFYVIDIGEYQSLKVPAHIVEKDNKFEVHQEVKSILGKMYADLQDKCFPTHEEQREEENSVLYHNLKHKERV